VQQTIYLNNIKGAIMKGKKGKAKPTSKPKPRPYGK